MRDFFIKSFEQVVNVIIILLCVGVIVSTIAALFTEGFLAALFILIFGALYVVLMGGMMYLALGIYNNTKRTADLLAQRQ